jgi:DNA anti-recombination protein RmuC
MPVMETPFAMYAALTSIEVPPEKVRVVVKSMESDMALFATSSQFNQLDRYSGSRLELLQTEIDGLRERMNERFNQVDQRFNLVDQRFDQMRTEIAELRNTMGTSFELVEGRFKQLKHELVAQLGGMIGGAVLLLGGLMALLKG